MEEIMHLKSRTWFLLSLLLFAAALWTWLYAEKRYSDSQRQASAPTTPARVPAAPAPSLIPAANQTQKPASYRLSNTGQSAGQLARNSHGIILRNALIDTALPVHLEIPPHLRAKGAPGSYIVQSDRALDQDFYDELTKIGATNITYIPNNAALVEATPAQAREMVQDPAFQAVLPWEPYYKLDATLLPAAVEQDSLPADLRVTTFPGQLEAAMAALTKLGATVVGQDQGPFGPSIIVQAAPGTLAAVAQLPLAQEIEAYTPRRALNDLTRVQVGVSTNTLTNAPNYLNLYGSNIWININDTGVDATHPDFSNRVHGLQVDFDGHGTHVAGSIAGSGAASGTVTNPVPGSVIPGADFRGKAKGAQLFVQGLDLVLGPYTSDAYLQSNASYSLTTITKTNGSAITNGFISNNSWGYQSMVYDTSAASYDAAVRDAQPAAPGEQSMLFVFAAGNSGDGSGSGVDNLEGTITSPATAKNVITVGAIDTGRFITNEVTYDGVTSNEVFFASTDNSNLVSFFSSAGDVGIGTEGEYGRFKPDVVAPGVFIVSCRASNFVDPTIETTLEYQDMPGQIVNPGQTNVVPILLPVDVSSLTIQIVPNGQSPNPFPALLIQNGPTKPPGGLAVTNVVTTTNDLAPGFWYVAVINPFIQPVSYDLHIYINQTNTLGDYYMVLSNLDNALLPHYRYETGTSMSAGAVSGMLALMQQFLQTNFPAHPNPSPALLKGLLINGARSLGTLYDFNTQPSAGNEQGWGLVNIQNSLPASMTNANSSLWFLDQSPTNALSTGQSASYRIRTADGNASNSPVRVTLVWTDPPGNPAAGIALVNDLELTVADGTGSNVYVGNDFRAGDIFTEVSSVTNPAPEDIVNNVQNVYLAPPIVFPLTVTVSGVRVNVNAVTTQTNQIAQDFALVVSSDDTALARPLVIRTNGIAGLTNALVTVANSGVPLLHQRVGANEPNLYNYPAGQTNGSLSQWHFFVFTNNQFTGTNQATNVLFATFYPPNLSVPRNSGADLDLYVSTKPSLTNLNPVAIEQSLKSLNQGGNEFIYLSNSSPNEVYYIGVKSEDQQAADFGFYSVAQQAPFSSVNLQTGDVTYYGTPIPVAIPDGSFDFPGQVTVLVAFQGSYNVRKVSVTLGIAHPNPGDLVATLTHPPSAVSVFLSNHTGVTNFTTLYDDMPENPAAIVSSSDGPGSLRDFVGQPAAGEWQLSVVDNALGVSGTVTAFSVTVSPQPPITGPIVIALPGGGGSYFNYVDVPNDALYLTNVVVFQSQGAGGPIGIFMTNENDVTTSDYGVNNIFPPGGYLLLGPTNTPPLSGGTWYYEIYNYGATEVTLTNYIYFLTSLTPNLVESLSNNAAIPLTTDGTTTSQICVSNGQQVVDLQVGLRITDPNLDDLSIHLISPQGTSVLLFENRGGLLASNLGLTLTNTNSTRTVYTVFTQDTNLTTTLIKFAPPPYASTNAISGLTTNVLSEFGSAAGGTYTNGEVVAGWTVVSNEVGIVADPVTGLGGSNFLALANGQIVQTFTTVPGASYELQYYARSPQLTDWWPGDDNAGDIVGSNNGTLVNMAFEAGEVGPAFTFTNFNGFSDSYVTFDTNAGNFGTRDFTIDFWIKTTNTAEQAVLNKRSACGLDNMWDVRMLANGELVFEMAQDTNPADYENVTTKTNINDGHFHEVAITRSGLVLAMYVDGILNGSLTNPGIDNIANTSLLTAGTDPCISGPGAPDGTQAFGGDLDELDLWSRALSPAEIEAIYTAGGYGKYSTNSLLPNFQAAIEGISTNTMILTNFAGGWEPFTNSFIATNNQVVVQLAGNPLGVLLASVQLVQLPSTNFNNYYLPEESLSPLIGENPQGCWTLQVTDTRNDSTSPTNGALLSWNMQVTISSTNVNLIVLTNGVTYIGIASNSITYFAVDVPATANFATNTLTVNGANPLNLLFNQGALPTGTSPGDVTLLSGVNTATGAGTDTLSTQGAPPPLLPGQRYFLAVQNNNPANERFRLQVSFDIATNQILALTNGIPVNTNLGPAAPQYYSFVVPGDASMVTFQVLNPNNAQFGLYARDGLPVPGPLNFDYDSVDTGTNDQFIVITTNSIPVPLPNGNLNSVLQAGPTAWYLAVYNFGGAPNASYTILATYVTNGRVTIVPLTNNVSYSDKTAAGFPTNLVYSFTVTNHPAGIEFTVTNTSGFGNVELLAEDGTFPTPQTFYSGSFNPGQETQVISIGTNAAAPSLNGIWYLAVPNTFSNVVKYTITAATIAGSTNVPTSPFIMAAQITSPTNGFTMYWGAQPGQTYSIDVSTDLLQWKFVTNITATSTTASYTDAVPVESQKARFFRLSTP
jgi:subtilisin-like proprotein convertase family protein